MQAVSMYKLGLLLPAIIFIWLFYTPSDLEAQERVKRRVIRRYHQEEVERLLYEKSNLDSALYLCRKIIGTNNIPDDYRRELENNIKLIENYSDYDRKPLKLYLQARHLLLLILSGNRSSELPSKQGDSYRELLSRYPRCKLAAFVHYQLAWHYMRQIGGAIARENALAAYREIIENYPTAVFEIWDLPKDYLLGSSIAPLAQLKIAWLQQSSHRDTALQAFQTVIDKYPEALDQQKRKLALSAYVSMLMLCSGDEDSNEIADARKAEEICRILLDKYPNQEYEIEGWYFGEIHPEALMRLAKISTDREKAIGFYKRIIKDYPNSQEGKSGSDAVGFYSTLAQRRLNELQQE
ncbi:tetratricopeptide repeat protein [candidate division KSB1 bacterium]|nr:tetratricopeptide repeat protein [candidate division KSB1 bacterium]